MGQNPKKHGRVLLPEHYRNVTTVLTLLNIVWILVSESNGEGPSAGRSHELIVNNSTVIENGQALHSV